MSEGHVPIFQELCNSRDVIIVSGAQAKQMRAQLPEARYFLLTQNGNHAIDRDGMVLWSETFSSDQIQAIDAFIDKIRAELNLAVADPNDLVEYRGSQVSYSLIGHHAPLEEKKAFDPSAQMRTRILAEHAEDVGALLRAGVEITAGGTTCFDMYLAGRNKGYNVSRLIEREGWLKDESIYVGDAIEKGRNDESVIGVLPTRSVSGPQDTFDFIKEMLI